MVRDRKGGGGRPVGETMETDIWGPLWVVGIKEEYEGVMGAGERSIKKE
jgi:hypothetical protein